MVHCLVVVVAIKKKPNIFFCLDYKNTIGETTYTVQKDALPWLSFPCTQMTEHVKEHLNGKIQRSELKAIKNKPNKKQMFRTNGIHHVKNQHSALPPSSPMTLKII